MRAWQEEDMDKTKGSREKDCVHEGSWSHTEFVRIDHWLGGIGVYNCPEGREGSMKPSRAAIMYKIPALLGTSLE